MAYVNSEYLKEQFENFSDKIEEVFAKKKDISMDGNIEVSKTYKPVIGSVESGEEANVTVDIDEDKLEAKFNFILPKGKDGRSVKEFITENNNIYVTFSDGKKELIGQLNIDIQEDFLTEGGFGKLRYYQNRFQYYNEETQDWVDTIVTPDNIYVVNMTPLPMRSIVGRYFHDIGHYKLKWAESPDTVIDGQVMCVVDKVIIRRKKDSAPTDINDGDLVIEIPRRQFGAYKTKWFVDETVSPDYGDTYYYKAFPVSATTQIYSNSTMNEVALTVDEEHDYELYGFEIDQNESAPEYMIRYIEDNIGWNPAHMDYKRDVFDYGDWTPENAFFMNVRPCMLNYDGTVAYYLNPDNYAYREDGVTPSEISDVNFNGNAMVQFPKIYWKITDLGDGRAEIRICNRKLDEGYNCWSHIDENGNEIPYCYMPIYNGSVNANTLRSLSGKTPLASQTAQTEVNYANANNKSGEHAWYTEVFSDRQLVNLLLLLIGKSTDTQAVFGNGNCQSGENVVLQTGTMNDKGLFFGSKNNTSCVKIFGMEHWWGNQWHRIAGWIYDNGVQKIKMTYGKTDGSSSNGYNLNGQGYISIINSNIVGSNFSYISKMLFDKNGIVPKASGGSDTTYYSDGLIFSNTQLNYILVGGALSDNFTAGAFYSYLYVLSSNTSWSFGASISCKPLLSTQQSDPNVSKEVA